jgi:hypothetical protein
MTETPLKLKGRDAEDVQVISAVLQDAIVPVCDMAWRPAENEFVMVVQRFRCEQDMASPEHGCERVCSAVHVRGVESVQVRGIDLENRDVMLDLLAVMPEGKMLQFVFAGGGRVRLQLADWSMILEDFGAPWPVTQAPRHIA